MKLAVKIGLATVIVGGLLFFYLQGRTETKTPPEPAIKTTETETSLEETSRSSSPSEESPNTSVGHDRYAAAETRLTEFLDVYFTYETYGDNIDQYVLFYLPDKQKELKKQALIETQTINRSSLQGSSYLESEVYIRSTGETDLTALCMVTVLLDSYDGEGAYEKSLSHQVSLKVKLSEIDKEVYVKQIEGIRIEQE